MTGLRPGRYIVALAPPFEPFTGLGVFIQGLTRIRAFDPAPRSETIDVSPGESVELVFDLDPDRLIPGTEGASVAGRITVGGEPAPGLRVLCEPSTANQNTQTDATGHFRLDGFPPREVTFRVLEGIGGSRKLWTQTLRLPASGTVPLEIDLEMVMLELTVRSAAHAPAPDHEVIVFGSHPEGASFELRAHTDRAGKIRISIPAAPATARIQGPLGTATCPLHPHADEPLQVEATLATPGVISGRIIPTPGGITPRCVVFNRASDDSPVAWTLVRGEEFRFHQANLEPGRYELRILDTDLEEHEAIPRFFDLPEHEGLLDQVLRVGAPRK